jgi:hypothetical protein
MPDDGFPPAPGALPADERPANQHTRTQTNSVDPHQQQTRNWKAFLETNDLSIPLKLSVSMLLTEMQDICHTIPAASVAHKILILPFRKSCMTLHLARVVHPVCMNPIWFSSSSCGLFLSNCLRCLCPLYVRSQVLKNMIVRLSESPEKASLATKSSAERSEAAPRMRQAIDVILGQSLPRLSKKVSFVSKCSVSLSSASITGVNVADVVRNRTETGMNDRSFLRLLNHLWKLLPHCEIQ